MQWKIESFNPRIISVEGGLANTFVCVCVYQCWAATGPSCTGTPHRTPAVWQTHYRSSAFAHTGRSWRASSFARWKEREGQGREESEQVEDRGKTEGGGAEGVDTYRLELTLSLICYLWNRYTSAAGNQTGFSHLTCANSQPTWLSTSVINTACSSRHSIQAWV